MTFARVHWLIELELNCREGRACRRHCGYSYSIFAYLDSTDLLSLAESFSFSLVRIYMIFLAQLLAKYKHGETAKYTAFEVLGRLLFSAFSLYY